MGGDGRDEEDARQAERATTEEARRRAGAAEGIEPTPSAEADEPTTALADRQQTNSRARSTGERESQ